MRYVRACFFLLLALNINAAQRISPLALFEFDKALTYHNANDYTAAINHYLKAIALDGTLVSAVVNLAIVYEKVYDSQNARYYYNEAVRIAPYSFSTRYNRGQFFQKQGKLKAARADYLVALQSRTDDASLYINLAALTLTIFEKENDATLLKDAEKKLKHAERLESNSPALYFNKARLLELKNSPSLARRYYAEAMRRYPLDSLEYKTSAMQCERLSQRLK
ncbi:MAG TPA: hypothetical protein PLY93_01310 [Turneriella sp.]|nr:hypothetical protein [Turneriella sp.]